MNCIKCDERAERFMRMALEQARAALAAGINFISYIVMTFFHGARR